MSCRLRLITRNGVPSVPLDSPVGRMTVGTQRSGMVQCSKITKFGAGTGLMMRHPKVTGRSAPENRAGTGNATVTVWPAGTRT